MKILVVTKQSKLEWEREKFGLDEKGIRAKYSSEHANLDAILKAHERQLATRKELHTLLPDADFLSMDKLVNPVRNYDAVLSLGGDNSFIYVTHYLDPSIPVIGINSDPGRSLGKLCAWNSSDLARVVRHLQEENYKIEKWPRLQATIDDKSLIPATSEYYFGEDRSKDMSRHVLIHRGKQYEQKSSGIILATGAGSTGWRSSAGRYRHPFGNQFNRTRAQGRFIVREPFQPNTFRFYLDQLTGEQRYTGKLEPGEEIILHSLNDGKGYATADSWEEYAFPRGSTAVVKISDQPLRVIVPAQ